MILSKNRLPYSIPGTYLCLQYRREGLRLRLLHGMGRSDCFDLVPLIDGEPYTPAPEEITLTPGGLTVRRGHRRLVMTLRAPDTALFGAEGFGLRLYIKGREYEYVARYTERRCMVNSQSVRSQFMISARTGRVSIDAPYGTDKCDYIQIDVLPEENDRVELAVDQFYTVWKPGADPGSAERAMADNEKAFDECLRRYPAPPERYARAFAEAVYILWSCQVPPMGFLKRRGVLASSNGMTSVWTWDGAIVSAGLSYGDEDVAWDQLVLPFDLQTPEGLLPDYINTRDVMWNFTKPPIHGLMTLAFHLRRLTDAQVRYLLPRLTAQIRYWFACADTDGDGICQYNHGNDCGWDNCTPFEVTAPVEGPDLTAYLIYGMRAVAALHRRLGYEAAAADWDERAEGLLQRLIEHSWDGERFVVYQSGTHAVSPRGDSLYPYLPLALGRLLPKEIFDKMAGDLKQPGRFLTEHGLATESVASPCYESDGYWRGPIWAPPTLLIAMGLRDGGEEAFARELARRFCDMCAESGFSENFDALTGEALRDPAYTWTAAVFIVLSLDYVSPDPA